MGTTINQRQRDMLALLQRAGIADSGSSPRMLGKGYIQVSTMCLCSLPLPPNPNLPWQSPSTLLLGFPPCVQHPCFALLACFCLPNTFSVLSCTSKLPSTLLCINHAIPQLNLFCYASTLSLAVMYMEKEDFKLPNSVFLPGWAKWAKDLTTGQRQQDLLQCIVASLLAAWH